MADVRQNLKIAIVIPAYNEEKYLASCLFSIKNQDYGGNYEVIVVDNGSHDRTSEVARSFGARLISCSQKGVVFARQNGADLAEADIIVQADADSVFPE